MGSAWNCRGLTWQGRWLWEPACLSLEQSNWTASRTAMLSEHGQTPRYRAYLHHGIPCPSKVVFHVLEACHTLPITAKCMAYCHVDDMMSYCQI